MSAPIGEVELDREAAPGEGEAPPAATVTRLVPVPPRPLASAAMPATTAASAGTPATSTAIVRAQLLGTQALAHVGYQLRRLGTTTLVGITAMVTAVTMFLAYNLPQGHAVTTLQGQLARLATSGAAAATTPNGATLASLPPRREAPEVVAKVYEEAKAAGIELPRGQYEYVPARDGVAARYRMTFPVRASYPQIRSFLDRTLIALPAVSVEGLRIERKSVGDGTVEAEVKLSAYVRGEP
jgi:hypothetical protein